MARGLFFIIGSFALFGVSLATEPKRKFNNLWVAAFFLLALSRVFFNEGICEHQLEWFNFWYGCANFIYVFCGVLLFYTVYCHADNIRQYLKPIIFVAIFNLTLVIAQLTGWDFLWTTTYGINGFLETPSQLGQYSALALPIMAYFHPLLAIIPLITLFASKSISPILASAFGMAFLGGFKGRILKIKVLIGVLLVILAIVNSGYIKGKFKCRPVQWRKTIKLTLDKPYLGWGYGSFQDKVTEIKTRASLGGAEYLRAHNDYLHTAQELGFPILIAIGLFFMDLFRKFKRTNKSKLICLLGVSVLIVLVNMSAQTLIRYASIAGTFVVLLALFCVEVKYGEYAS